MSHLWSNSQNIKILIAANSWLLSLVSIRHIQLFQLWCRVAFLIKMKILSISSLQPMFYLLGSNMVPYGLTSLFKVFFLYSKLESDLCASENNDKMK